MTGTPCSPPFLKRRCSVKVQGLYMVKEGKRRRG